MKPSGDRRYRLGCSTVRCAAEMPPLHTGCHHGSRFIVPDESGNSTLAMVCIGLDDIDLYMFAYDVII